MKRTPEEAQAAVEEVKQMLKADPNLTVEQALKKKKLQPSTWYKYKSKRKPYTKKEPSLSEVKPVLFDSETTEGLRMSRDGGKHWTVITTDPGVVEMILGRFL